jgi:hypothetical protein
MGIQSLDLSLSSQRERAVEQVVGSGLVEWKVLEEV